MSTLSESQVAATAALTAAFKANENREAAKIAAAMALYYSRRVDAEDPSTIEAWLNLLVPRLIEFSDRGAQRGATFFDTARRLEVPNVATDFRASPALGVVDPGVRESLLKVGPYDFVNKATDIRNKELSPAVERALLRQAKAETVKKVTAATIRHAQAGGRETIHRAAEDDPVALGFVRVTDGDPCHFCAMLASRGLRYRAFKEDSFDLSNRRFNGDGDAKVHDKCGCSLKPVYTDNDPLVKATEKYADLWSRWGAGGGRDAALRFRRGYEHLQETGEYLTFEQVDTA